MVTFHSLSKLNNAIAKQLEAYSHRSVEKKDGNCYELFIEEERPTLKPLAEFLYVLTILKKVTVPVGES